MVLCIDWVYCPVLIGITVQLHIEKRLYSMIFEIVCSKQSVLWKVLRWLSGVFCAQFSHLWTSLRLRANVFVLCLLFSSAFASAYEVHRQPGRDSYFSWDCPCLGPRGANTLAHDSKTLHLWAAGGGIRHVPGASRKQIDQDARCTILTRWD